MKLSFLDNNGSQFRLIGMDMQYYMFPYIYADSQLVNSGLL